MSTIFFTGVPGFLGTALLPRVLARDPEATAVCLVQPRYAGLAQERVARLSAAQPELAGRISLVEGDITRPGLGLEDPAGLAARVGEIYHLAAVYDLSVARELGMRINVDGTRHMLDFAESCAGLSRFQYVSTCYVSGRYVGIFSEDDLEKGQRFNNYYEETKYLAEVLVRRRISRGLPATVYRPAIVVGDRRSGETQKYDGPYLALRLLLRQPRLAVMPVLGDPRMYRMNIVPRDFVIDAITYLSGLAESRGKTYQLADSAPLTIDEILQAMGAATGRVMLRVPLPPWLARAALERLPLLERLMGIPASALAYMVHPTHYTTFHSAQDLAASGLRVPPLTSYIGALASYVRANPHIGSAAMI